ncbi:hypothetical protein ACFO4N_06775 [Camelliibacillus cellulosilyticus]|uniref:Lipoprotein n=1 Tax=Camelliibacillus cellulosilyticus TaxID=2174486 RepID=A0ABV9GMF4_9BACL
MRKRLMDLMISFGVLIFVLTACSQTTVKNDTALNTAKSLIQAMIKGDKDALTKIVPENSPTDSPTEMLLIADNLGMKGMKMSDFKFKEEAQKEDINVYFNDSNGEPVEWELYFRKSPDTDTYTFGKFFSGRVIKNGSTVQVAKTLMRGILANDPAFVAKVRSSNTQLQTKDLGLGPIEDAKRYITSQTKMMDLKFSEAGVYWVDVTLQNKRSKVKQFSIFVNLKDDQNNTTASIGEKIQVENNTVYSATRNYFLQGIRLGRIDSTLNNIFLEHTCQREYAFYNYVQKHGIAGMSREDFRIYDTKDPNTQEVDFENQAGKTVKWILTFKQKDGLFYLDKASFLPEDQKKYKPDVDHVPQGSPMEAAQSIVRGLIDQNPDYLAYLMYTGPCGPAYQLLQSPKTQGVDGMKLEDFHLNQGTKDTINVSFKNKQGKQENWMLHFKAYKNKYYLDQSDLLSAQ